VDAADRYVRSPVYALRVVLGAVLLGFGLLVTVLFENALIGLFWLPILPGWVAFAWMQRAGKL
jgi:hypothetical protein